MDCAHTATPEQSTASLLGLSHAIFLLVLLWILNSPLMFYSIMVNIYLYSILVMFYSILSWWIPIYIPFWWCSILSWPPSSAALPRVRRSNPSFSSSIREKLHLNISTQSQHTEATEVFSWELNHLQTLSCVLHRFSISRCLVARGESFHWLSLFFKSSTVLKTRYRNWLSWQRGSVLPAQGISLSYLLKNKWGKCW